MKKLHEDSLVPIVIDLAIEEKQINETYLRQLGVSIELMLKRMFGLNDLHFKLRGPRNSVDKFIRTLESERDYANAFRRMGLNDSSVLNNKWKLQQAIGEFEKTTGIKWPLK